MLDRTAVNVADFEWWFQQFNTKKQVGVKAEMPPKMGSIKDTKLIRFRLTEYPTSNLDAKSPEDKAGSALSYSLGVSENGNKDKKPKLGEKIQLATVCMAVVYFTLTLIINLDAKRPSTKTKQNRTKALEFMLGVSEKENQSSKIQSDLNRNIKLANQSALLKEILANNLLPDDDAIKEQINKIISEID